jgi:serine/threonine-protein kinase
MPLGGQQSDGFRVAGTTANEGNGMLSPDGKFVAYQSDESGRTEIFVQAFPSGNKWQVTTAGGTQPRWASGGRELIYRNGSSVTAVPVTVTPFSVGTPQTLFTLQNLFAFDVTADGKTFVVAQDGRSRENVEFVLVSGWFEELKAKMQGRR